MNQEDLTAALFMGAIGMTLSILAVILSVVAILK